MGLFFEKSGEMGIGTLIIFIATLLVCAIAAAVLIDTSHQLEETSYATGNDARKTVSTNINVIQILATDGRGNLSDFREILKLSPGSTPIRLDGTMLSFNTIDMTSTLEYKGEGSICALDNQNGYNTYSPQEFAEVNTSMTPISLEEDLDDDGLNEELYINSSVVFLNLSSQGLFEIPMGADIADASTVPVTLNVVDYIIANSSETLAYVTISGTTDQNDTILADMTFKVTPYNIYKGYYSAVYENKGSGFMEGRIGQGDVVKLCFQAPRVIVDDEEIRISLIPKIGTPTSSSFYTPQAMAEYQIILYP